MKMAKSERIFFPWEHRGGWLRRLGLDRLRPFLLAMLVLGLTLWVGFRERQDAGVRRTRAVIESYRAAIDTYMAEHEQKCPPDLEQLRERSEVALADRDAWGRPLRFVCPWPGGEQRYRLTSDGPDGESLGLDRIE